jgi:hypothetical protein
MDEKLFNDSFGVKIGVKQVVGEAVRFMKEDEKRKYKVMIGTDSSGSSEEIIDFITAVVIHRVGNGGRYFWRRINLNRFHTLRDRIIQEVLFSLDVAKEVLSALKELDGPPEARLAGGGPQFDFEIHIDVGENGETKTVMQEVLGMVRAYNFEARVKPESYAASSVADRHV